MRRRALLAAASAATVVPLAGCSTPPWSEDPTQVDGATLTLRQGYDGEIAGYDRGPRDIAELRRSLDGARECYRIAVREAKLDDGTLDLRMTTVYTGSDTGGCPDVGQTHPYSLAIAFHETAVPNRAIVRHGDEIVLDEPVATT